MNFNSKLYLTVNRILLSIFIKFIFFQHGFCQYNGETILSPHIPLHSSKFAFFHPRNITGRSSQEFSTSTQVPWEEALKESVQLALGDANIGNHQINKAPYIGYIDISSPKFGDIVVLAKGKLKQNSNNTFSFVQLDENVANEQNFLENVTALWMVERIRHRDPIRGHRFDLKFTVVPIYHENPEEFEENFLENHLKSQRSKTFILRDSDYPKYFTNIAQKLTMSRRNDMERSLYLPMTIDRTMPFDFDPGKLMQTLLSPFLPQETPRPHKHLNIGEIYMQTSPSVITKYKQSYPYHIPQIYNKYFQSASTDSENRVKFPENHGGGYVKTVMKGPYGYHVYSTKLPPIPMKTNLYDKEMLQESNAATQQNHLIDFRGALDNIYGKPTTLVKTTAKPLLPVANYQTISKHPAPGTQQIQQNHPQALQPGLQSLSPNYSFQTQHPKPQTQLLQQHNPQAVKPTVYTLQNPTVSSQVNAVPVVIHQMPFVQMPMQTPYAIPLQIQLATPNNQILVQQPLDTTTVRYMQPAHPYQFVTPQNNNQPQSSHLIQYKTQPAAATNVVKFGWQDIRRNHTKLFHESEPLPNSNKYSYPDPIFHPYSTTTQSTLTKQSPYYVTPQIETPLSTASSIQVNMYDSNGFRPITRNYKSQQKAIGDKILAHNSVELSLGDPRVVTGKPDSINAQLPIPEHSDDDTKGPYVILPSDKPEATGTSTAAPRSNKTNTDQSVSSTQHENTSTPAITETSESSTAASSTTTQNGKFEILSTRLKYHQRTTEKPILKWIPKKKSKFTNSTSTSTQNSLVPTEIPIETTTNLTVTRPKYSALRGRNRFARRKESTLVSSSQSTNPGIITKVFRKKVKSQRTTARTTTTGPSESTLFSTVYPTYMPTTTDDPTTEQYSTSVSIIYAESPENVDLTDFSSLETTTLPDDTTNHHHHQRYEMTKADMETIPTNNTNVVFYRASDELSGEDYSNSETTEKQKVDDIALTILNHARTIQSNDKQDF